ncbi:S8 family serine peptidase [Aeromonas sp. FDAARGOS 1409]|uniref:S8 family serine peptidase n=1 Tax=Aeromonas TaxID=642 RepID=UPI001C20FB42|nr:S8 family serine peptidase [Aeromonas sp. FDAARGOS 1409]QXC28458.1 S8 family serine peptidase [Aeromonas sp. FDAARGOS 1409]
MEMLCKWQFLRRLLTMWLPLLVGCSLIGGAMAMTPAKEMTKVLISFSVQPGASEEVLVRGLGGKIRHNYHLVPALAATVPLTAIPALRRNPNITDIELDIEVHAVDAELDNSWGVRHIGAGTAHASGNRGNGVRVAILDSGVDTNHPDLNYDPGCSANFVDGETIEDGNGHGTHAAGIVAALDNDMGVVGVAPEATLCIYKVLNNAGSGNFSDIIAALQQAITDHVQITNNSYGSAGDPGNIVRDAFDNAYAAGLLHVGAAGNSGNPAGTGENCIFPARWSSVIATAATTSSDVRTSFSSTCPEVELAAPGNLIHSTIPDAEYGDMSGTSMASPHVAGTAALVLAANPGWSNEEIRRQLQGTAQDLGEPGRDTSYGYGLINAALASGSGATNQPPQAYSQTMTTDQDKPVAITLNGSDPDGDPLNFSVLNVPTKGVLSGTPPTLIYTPDPGFSGSDSFTFTVSDGELASTAALVSLTVLPVIATDTVSISKATYSAKKKKLDLVATSSAGSSVALTAKAFSSNGIVLGSVSLSYSRIQGKFTGSIAGLSTKPFKIVISSSGGGSDSVEGNEIGG